VRQIRSGNPFDGGSDPFQRSLAQQGPFHRVAPNIGGELDGLLNFWTIFWRRRVSLLILAICGSLIGFGITLPKPIMYDAKAVMETQPAQNVAGLGQQDGDSASANAVDATIRTQIETLRSGALRSAVVARLEREMSPSLPPVPPGILYRLRRYVLEHVLHRQEDNPVKALRQALVECSSSFDARGMMGTRVIILACESTNPETAALYLNTLVKEFSEQAVQDRRGGIEQRTRWMAEQMEYLRDKLEKSEQKLQAFLRSGGTGVTNEPDVLKQTRLQQMEQIAATLEADRTAKQTLLESAQSAPVESFVLTPEGAPLKLLFNKLQSARREVADLSQKLTPEHIRLKTAQRQVDELEEEFRGQRDLVLTRLRRDVEAAQVRQRTHNAAYSRQTRNSVSAPAEKVIEHNILQRQVELDRQLYQSFMTNIQQASLLLALPVNTARLIDPAQANLQPIQARTWTLNTVLGMFSALLMGGVWVVLREKTTRRVFSPEDVTTLLQLPELGVIPSTQEASLNGWRSRLKWIPGTRSDSKNVLDLSPEAVPDESVEFAAWGRSRPSLFSESFRGALASLTGLARQGIRPQTLVITSASPKEGKSTVATNLAITLAESNHRVLLIDADLRSPRLHKLLTINNNWGLADILQETPDIEEYPIEALVKQTRIPHLGLMPSGARILDPGRLFYSQRLLALIMRLRREFEYIIIDTPPVLDFADARFLGRVADGVLLVLRSGSTDRGRAFSACQRMIEDGLVVLGTILNDWNVSNSQYGYDYVDPESKEVSN
jgi:polysaccharide biosynthesis transport protein